MVYDVSVSGAIIYFHDLIDTAILGNTYLIRLLTYLFQKEPFYYPLVQNGYEVFLHSNIKLPLGNSTSL